MAASSMVETDPNALCSWVTRTRGDVPPPLVVRPFTLRRPLFSLENVRLLLSRLGKQAEQELQDTSAAPACPRELTQGCTDPDAVFLGRREQKRELASGSGAADLALLSGCVSSSRALP